MLFFFRRTGEQHQSPEDEKQINKTFLSKYDESDKEDEEQSSTTEPTVRENIKYEQRTEKDTDEDASFSENEQILSKSFTSDEQQQSLNAIRTNEQSRPSSIISTNEIQDDHEIISKTIESSINDRNKSESQVQSIETQVKQPDINIDQKVMFFKKNKLFEASTFFSLENGI
jgi:hypothetical protein